MMHVGCCCNIDLNDWLGWTLNVSDMPCFVTSVTWSLNWVNHCWLLLIINCGSVVERVRDQDLIPHSTHDQSQWRQVFPGSWLQQCWQWLIRWTCYTYKQYFLRTDEKSVVVWICGLIFKSICFTCILGHHVNSDVSYSWPESTVLNMLSAAWNLLTSLSTSWCHCLKLQSEYIEYIHCCCSDVSGVELLMNNHQSLRAEIDARAENFSICVNLGKDLLHRRHPRSDEVRLNPYSLFIIARCVPCCLWWHVASANYCNYSFICCVMPELWHRWQSWLNSLVLSFYRTLLRCIYDALFPVSP